MKKEVLTVKKWLGGIIVTMLSVVLLVGCAPEEKQSKVATEGQEVTIRLGVMPSTDNIPFIIAQKEGYAKEQGVKLELEVFKSANDRDAALQAGKLDGVITDLVAVAIYRQGDLDVKVVAAPYDQFDLVANGEAKTVADLKGKEVVFAARTGTAYAIDMMLKEAGLTRADIKANEVPQVPARLELLTNKKVAGAILPEPFVTMAKADQMTVVQSTRDIGINPFAIAFTTDFIDEQSDAIRGMFDAYNQAVTYLETTDKSEYIELFIAEVGFPETLKEQIEIPDYGKIEQVKVADIDSAFEWARQEGLLKKELNGKDVISHVYFN